MEIVAADIGGTRARFAIATLDGRKVCEIGAPAILRTADYVDLPGAWRAFAQASGRDLPRAASLALACPVDGDVLRLTNTAWTMRKADLPAALGVDRLVLLNDFEAIGHAVLAATPAQLAHVCGPDEPLPERGVISIVGPGTGLGVAHIVRDELRARVTATEGGHIGFAPQDDVEDAILARLRALHGRVSVERVASGPGLSAIHDVLREREGASGPTFDNIGLWQAALAGADPLATAALERFCLCLGAVAGDIVLAQGASALVIAGGLGGRIGARLAQSGFAARLVGKGRFADMMRAVPVRRLEMTQPGLLGAAAAFAGDFTP